MTTKRKRGRPRQAATDTAILDAASELIAQRGYRGMTVGAVAATAGVSEPTVYLRYATKHDLAVAAVARRPFLTHPPDTGDSIEDLAALLTALVETAEAIGMSIVGVVLAEEPEHPELLAHWRATVGSVGLRAVDTIIERGRRRGDIRPDLHAPLVADLIVGAYLARYTHQGPPDRRWARDIVEMLAPALRGHNRVSA
ncbi:MAG TPA: TetR/AcrR family transcriptional regulator [Acidimicrobiales bacterium]|nr:TetR/AcrR family transcriptional regulator [Acidimicrobiales bacterium]